MNNNNGALDFDAYIADTDFKRSLDEMKARIIGLSKTAESEGDKMDAVFKKVGAGLAAYFSATTLKNFGQELIKVRGDFQQLEVAFTTMLGSKEKADALMDQIVKTAATTPFDLQGVANGAKQLLAYGESAENVNDTIVRLGNIASGLSLPLNDLVYLYGTTMVQGRLFTQDVRQFMGRGIPLVQELSKELGKTTDEINQMVTDGKIGFPEVQRVIENLTNEGGMFYNLMEAQSKTLTGQISNLEDAWASMLNNIGKQSEGALSAGIEFAATLVENYETILKILKTLIITYGAYKTAVIAFNVVQAVQIELAKGYTLAELAKYRALLLVEGAQKLLNKTMLANPYILAATALVGLITAVVTFADSTSVAEEQQNRLNEAIKRADEEVATEIGKIEALTTVIKSETAAQEDKNKALRELIALSPDHLSGITEETIRNGEATVAIDNYVEALRKKILMQQLEQELAESIKREEAAKKGENEIGWFRQMLLGAAQSEYNTSGGAMVGGPIDFVGEANKALNEEIIAQEQAFQKNIKAEIAKIYESSGSGSTGGTDALGVGTVGARIQEITDKISALEVQRNKLNASDAAGIAKINAEIAALNKEKSRLEGKGGKSGTEAVVEGSLNYYKKIKEDALKSLNNLNASDANFATKQAALLRTVADAEKHIAEIELGSRSFAEQLEVRKNQYRQYNRWVEAVGKETADAEFKGLIEGGKTYVDYLNGQIATLQSLQSAGNLGGEDAKRLVTLLEARDEATGVKSPIDKFKEGLAAAKEDSESLVEYLEKIKQLEQELEGDNSELGIEKRGILADEDEETTKEIESQVKGWLKAYEGYEQKRNRLTQEYEQKRKLIEERNTDGQYDEQLKNLEKEFKANLSALDAEVMAKSDLWIRLFANASYMSKKQIREVIADTKQLLDYLNGATTDKPIGFTEEQLQSLKEDPEKIKAIYDALNKQQEELEGRTDYLFSDIVKGIGNLKEASDLAKKAQSEQNDETRKAIELQAEMARQKGMSQILSGIAEFGNVVSQFAGKIGELADATGDEGLKNTAEAMNDVGNIISATAMGAATGGWVGAVIGGITSIGSALFDSFTKGAKTAAEAEKNAADWARAYQLLALELKEEDYESVFGTKSIARTAEVYRLLVESLDLYNEALNGTGKVDLAKDLIAQGVSLDKVLENINASASTLQNMSIKTKDYGWFAELFGKKDQYTSLKDLAPEIWADGGFNVEAARAFLETNTQLTEEQRTQIQHVIDLYDQYEELNDMLEQEIADSFGDLGSSLIKSITTAITTGEDALELFADSIGLKFEELGEKIAYELFFADMFANLQEELKATYGLGGTEAIGSAQMELIAGFFSSMKGQAANAQEWLEQWKEMAAEYGFDLWSGDLDSNEDPLAGAVSKITSEEASAIAGQMTMIRIKQDITNDYLDQQLTQLVGIRENTGKTVDKLDVLIEVVKGGSSETTNTLRSKGL